MLELLLLCSLCLPHSPNRAVLEETRSKQHFYHVDKEVLYLAGLQTGAILYDGITTERSLQRPIPRAGYSAGFYIQETNPVGRSLLGPYPTWNRMIPLGAAEIVGSAYLAQYLKHRHSKLWWLPQLSLSVVHGVTGSINIRVAKAK
jgi:hypothetical protein